MAIPFGTSIVLVLGSSEVEAAQPRALIGDHLISTLVGLLVVTVTRPQPCAAALVVGLAVIAMHATRTFHPPAGIDPLLVVINAMPWSFLIAPVAAAPCCWRYLPISGTLRSGATIGRIAGGEAHDPEK